MGSGPQGRNSGTPRIAPDGATKSKSHSAPAFSPEAAAQPGAQGDAGCVLGFVAWLSRRAA